MTTEPSGLYYPNKIARIYITSIQETVGGETMQKARRNPQQVPATTPESDAMAKALKKRGFTFVGSTICYAFMQAAGLVNDHLVSCYRHRELKRG